jgi:hypothetical protein
VGHAVKLILAVCKMVKKNNFATFYDEILLVKKTAKQFLLVTHSACSDLYIKSPIPRSIIMV